MSWLVWGDEKQNVREPEKPSSVVMERKKVGSHSAVGNRLFKYHDADVREARIVRSSILKGYAEGSIINLVGVPKSGKTAFAMQECMTASVLGGRCLYVFNESPRWAFMRIIKKYKDALDLAESDVGNVYFMDMVDENLSVAQYKAIEEYMTRVWVGKIKQWLSNVRNPQFVVVDSFSEIVRKYIPQAYHAMKYFTDGLNNVMIELKKFPVVLLINQKSGGASERNDETVLGGYGLVHKTDGSILLRLREINRFEADRYGLADGSVVHTLQVVEMREVDYDTSEYVLVRDNGVLKLGLTLENLKWKAGGRIHDRRGSWGTGEG